jgi:hypothetical protein
VNGNEKLWRAWKKVRHGFIVVYKKNENAGFKFL